MTGNELARQLLNDGHTVIGFDNFFASSIDAVQDIVNNKNFLFYEYDLNNVEQMSEISRLVGRIQQDYARTIYINCAAVVHTEHFYEVEHTFTTNVVSMRSFCNRQFLYMPILISIVLLRKFIPCNPGMNAVE